MRAPRRRSAAPSRTRPAPRAEEVATLRIDALAAGGAGVGRLDGLTCFVPRTAVGDLAQIAYINHGRYARGRVLQVLDASPDRVVPRCAHYDADACGGCQLQHLSGDAQRDARRQIVRDALQRVGHREVALPELVAGPEWGYRERLTLTLRAKGAGVIGGMIPLTHPAQAFPLESCEIAHPRLMECWRAIRLQLRGAPTSVGESVVRLSLRLLGDAASRVALVVSGASQWDGAVEWATRLAAANPIVGAIWWEPAARGAVHLAGDADREVLAFAQVNRVVSEALREHVLSAVRALDPARVVDAYSGRGDLAAAMARDGRTVVAIEADASATASASLRLAAFPSARVVTALVEQALDDALPADVVVLNPPRRGVDVRVTALLADAADRGVRGIVYVSCDPATLARDLTRLAHWRLASVRCFDMFPQTAHVETVCVLVPEES
jgi:23S rRNA (uracil1939-C5)-methyltransferase